jgi:hypothetical protein
MAHGDVEPVPIHRRHHPSKVVPMAGLTLADIVLPLMDHLVSQRAVHFREGLVAKQGNRQPDETVLRIDAR